MNRKLENILAIGSLSILGAGLLFLTLNYKKNPEIITETEQKVVAERFENKQHIYATQYNDCSVEFEIYPNAVFSPFMDVTYLLDEDKDFSTVEKIIIYPANKKKSSEEYNRPKNFQDNKNLFLNADKKFKKEIKKFSKVIDFYDCEFIDKPITDDASSNDDSTN